MKHCLLILILGVLAGLGTHTAWHRFRQPATAPGLVGQLDWMRRELQLSPGQFARIKALHESSHPRLQALAHEVARLQAELAAFENERQTQDRIDFLEFARFVETRRTVDRECLDSTHALMTATLGVMDDRQRTRYLAWLGPQATATRVH